MKILVFIAGFFAAVLLRSFVTISPLEAVFVLLVGFAIFLAEKINSPTTSGFSSDRIAVYLSIIILSFGLGILRYDIKDFHTLTLEDHVDKKVELAGIVTSEPEKRDTDTRFIVETGTENILVSTDAYTDINYGDEINFTGTLKKPGVIEEDRGFDYGAYLAREDVYYTISFSKASIISRGRGNVLIRNLLGIKAGFNHKISSILPEPESSLLSGLLISGKMALSQNILDEFKRAGVVHIVVLSGYNITIVAKFFFAIFGAIFVSLKSRRVWIPKLASVLGIVLFVLMAGATPSIVRAAIMALVVVGGDVIGRTYNVSRALIFAAFLMLLWNPKILVFDPSFQLSFLATIGMIYITPIVSIHLSRVRWNSLREILSVTLATQIAVLPSIIYSMGNFSLVSLFSNILILPLVPLTMLVGFLAIIVSFATPMIALPLTYISHLLLAWILFVAHALGNMRYAVVEIKQFSVWIVILAYVLLAVLYVFLRRERPLPGYQTSPYTDRPDL
jgi:competence protein ComEC